MEDFNQEQEREQENPARSPEEIPQIPPGVAATVLDFDEELEYNDAFRNFALQLSRTDSQTRTSVSKSASNTVASPEEEAGRTFLAAADKDIVTPPYDLELLCRLHENSNVLRQCIDAYVNNIEGFGYRLEPVIDPTADDADEKIANAIYLRRLKEAADSKNNSFDDTDGEVIDDGFDGYAISPGASPHGDVFNDASGEDRPLIPEPTKKEIKEVKTRLARQMKLEKAKADAFFSYCFSDGSFIDLRKRTRHDRELTGNSYWEVIRDPATNAIRKLSHIKSHMMRLCVSDEKFTPYIDCIKDTPLTIERETDYRRFRRFAQVVSGKTVFFKEFGDPRLISSLSGKVYASPEHLAEAEPLARAATEIIHFYNYSSLSAYGIPRWIGVLLSVLGSRQAEEINFLYFENKSIPPLAIIVSGGRLAKSSVPTIKSYIKEHIKGKKNFHSILILEAEDTNNTSGSGKVKIELKPLTGAQLKDELFSAYDERNMDKVGGAFRLPRMLRGDIRDFNKGTADAALLFADMQVFQPERDEFDAFVNRKLLPELGIRFWVFRSNAPISKDPTSMVEAIRKLVNANILVPEEGRWLAAQVFGVEFKKVSEKWATQPIAITLAEIKADQQKNEPSNDPDAGNLEPAGMKAVKDNKVSTAKAAVIDPDDNEGSEVITIRVPRETLVSWMVPG